MRRFFRQLYGETEVKQQILAGQVRIDNSSKGTEAKSSVELHFHFTTAEAVDAFFDKVPELKGETNVEGP